MVSRGGGVFNMGANFIGNPISTPSCGFTVFRVCVVLGFFYKIKSSLIRILLTSISRRFAALLFLPQCTPSSNYLLFVLLNNSSIYIYILFDTKHPPSHSLRYQTPQSPGVLLTNAPTSFTFSIPASRYHIFCHTPSFCLVSSSCLQPLFSC